MSTVSVYGWVNSIPDCGVMVTCFWSHDDCDYTGDVEGWPLTHHLTKHALLAKVLPSSFL